MKLRELPGFSRHYVDFIEGTPPSSVLWPERPTRESLRRRAQMSKNPDPRIRDEITRILYQYAERIGTGPKGRENIRRLGNSTTRAVLVELKPALLGGNLAQFLLCIRAIGLAESLRVEGVDAVAIGWLASGPEPPGPVRILDSDFSIRSLEIGTETKAAWPEKSKVLLEQLSSISAPAEVNRDYFGLLARAWGAGQSPHESTARLLASVLNSFGFVLADLGQVELRACGADAMGSLPQHEIEDAFAARKRALAGAGYKVDEVLDADPVLANALFPAIANVIDPATFLRLSLNLPLFARASLETPLPWPALTATLVDARSRKILDKYKLTLPDLFAGKDALLAELEQERAEGKTLERFDELTSDIEAGIEVLESVADNDGPLHQVLADSRSKMQYQIGKIRERYVTAVSTRRDAEQRQFDRLCNLLAPARHLQQDYLASLSFLLRYSAALGEEIMRKSDVWGFDHQQIFLD